MPRHDNEQFPLGVVPVFTLGDAGLGDVDAHLATVGCFDKLGERASGVNVHLQVIDGFVGREVAEVGREESFGKR